MPAVVSSALLIFVLRLVDVSLYTLRMAMIVRGRKGLAWIFGLFQSVVFITAIRAVFAGRNDLWSVFGYAAGFATGNIIGMLVENRLAIGYTHLRIISPGRGAELIEKLRHAGYAATEITGRGRWGTVAVISCHVRRKDSDRAVRLAAACDDQAFITAKNVRQVRYGFWK